MKNNQANQNTAQKLSFYELIANKNYRVEIPIIQRDYAQGRKTARSVRSSFLEALYDYLVNNDNSNDLDFVYGSLGGEKNDVFVPLDGQQRLTTLFLLHWYLANKENQCDHFRGFMVNGDTSKFSYATRASAGEFCNALAKCQISFTNLLNDSLSITLKDKPWYFESWDNDPTIIAMFIMLDDMHEKFRSYEENNLYDRLCNAEKPAITFQFLNIETLKLTEDLYIKMNARGKPLTDFENLKAKLEQQIRKLDNSLHKHELHSQEVSASKYFSHKIDTDWANVFWNFRDKKTNTFDAGITNFMRLVIASHIITTNVNDNTIGDLLGTGGSLRELSFLEYEKLGCLKSAALDDLIAFFDAICKVDAVEMDSFYYPVTKCFERVLSSNTSYMEKLRFYAFYSYLIKFDSTNGITDWMRVIYNLTENTIYNTVLEYANSIRAINELLPCANTILDYISDPLHSLKGFSTAQISEERIKACLILKGDNWRDEIISIEKNEYFKGQVGFLLDFAGIVDYYQENENCSWEEADNSFFNVFVNYAQNAGKIFEIIKDDSSKLDYLWERAVLSKGDYFTTASSSRYNILSTRQSKRNIERDHSWKRLLRLTTKQDSWKRRQLHVKQVLDNPLFDQQNVKSSLQAICDSAIKSDQLEPWRKCLIRNKELIQYCNQGFIKKAWDGAIYLLGESQMNHYHAEIRSYALYTEYIIGGIFSPFNYIGYDFVKSSWEDAYIKLYGLILDDTDYKIEIQYLSDKERYEISFMNSNFSDIPKYLEEILISNQMEAVNSYKYIHRINTDRNTIDFLNKICQKLFQVNDRES